MILVDTSVWINHFRRSDAKLVALLESGQVLVHPFVVGELACGNLANRVNILNFLNRLPQAVYATDPEVLAFIEQRALMGRGIGYIDAHLLAASMLSAPARLWTKDKALGKLAEQLNMAH